MDLSSLSTVSAGVSGVNPLQLLWHNCNYFLSQVKEIMINGEDLKKKTCGRKIGFFNFIPVISHEIKLIIKPLVIYAFIKGRGKHSLGG